MNVRVLLLATLIVLVLVSISGCRPSEAVPAPVVSGDTGIHRLLVQPDDLQKANRETIRRLIASARRSIYLTIYEMSDQEIIDSIVAAKTANTYLDIRVIFNCASFKVCNQPGQNDHKDPNAVAKRAFSNAGILWKNAAPQFAVTHQKTLTVDEATSLIATFNFCPDYFVSTRDFGVITTDPDEVKEIVTVFENDWATPVIPSTPTLLVWSPENSRQMLKSVIASANRSLDVYIEEFDDREIADAMIVAANRLKSSGGVVRVITAVLSDPDKRSMDRNLAMRRYLNQNGVLARYGDWRVDPGNANSAKMYIHAKMILADYGTAGARAFVGSENFSPTSLDKNRELGIILKQSADAGLLSTISRTFSDDWSRCGKDR
jgi:phosphatidylserine/phosphatidylglycerophosphate/cardiolipin synthase-like enzyme